MVFSGTHVERCAVSAGAELVESDLRAFRARLALALAAAHSVVLDLHATKHIDAWAMLALVELAETYAGRLTLAAPDELSAALVRIEPAIGLALDRPATASP